MSKYILIIFLILGILINISMISRIPESNLVELENILKRYNYMDYEYIVNLYKEVKVPEFPQYINYILAHSLFRLSNYQEVLKFTNSKLSDELLSNSIILLCAFSLSELGEFKLSESLLSETTKKPHLKHYEDLACYYKFRNNLFLERLEELQTLQVSSKFLKNEDIQQIIKIIKNNSKDMKIVLSLLKVLPSKVNNLLPEIKNSLEISRIKSREMGQQLIRLGLTKEGYTIFLNSTTNETEKMYYQAKILNLDGEVVKSLDIVKEIKKHYSNSKGYYLIPYDDVKILEIDCYSKILDNQKFNEFILKELPNSSKKVLNHILSKYMLLRPDVHLQAIRTFAKITDFSNSDYKYIRTFVSYHLNEGNLELVKNFTDLMLKVSKNTDWEREFLALKYKFSEAIDDKTNISIKLITYYPMTYEYYTILNEIKENKDLLENMASNLLSLHSQIKLSTNISIDKANSLIGISLALKILSVTNTLEGDMNFILSKVSINFGNHSNTNKIPSYLDNLYNYGLILDLHMELGKILEKPNIVYMNYYNKFRNVSTMCKVTESFGLSKNLYFKRGIFLTYFKDYLYPVPYYEEVVKNSEKYNVDVSLVYSIMRSESRYSPFVLSIANAIGLMQLVIPTASSVGKRFLGIDRDLSMLDIYIVDRNIELGVAHISELINFFSKYPESLKELLVVSSYNAGATAVLKWYRSLKTSDPITFVEGIRYLETYNYTKSVIENRYFYDNFIFNYGNALTYKVD